MPKPRRTSDATLVRRSQQGDRRAFSALLGRYDWRLRGLAHALLLDRAEMDVALATGYLRAWRDVVRVDAKEDVAAWLYRVTYNACVDQLRRADGASSPAPSAGPASDAAEAAPSRGSGIAAGLATLPAAERVAVVLVDREGFSAASAARILGMAESTLSATLDAARERLTPYIPEPESEVLPVDEVAEPAEAPGNGSQPHEPAAVEAPARAHGANGAHGATDDDDATVASPEDEDAAPPSDRPDAAAAAATTADGTGPGPGPGTDAATGKGPTGNGATGEGATGEGATDNGSGKGATGKGATGVNGNGNGNGTDKGNDNGRTDGNGSRGADRNRGKGRRARRRVQHAAGQPQAEGPATPRDDAT